MPAVLHLLADPGLASSGVNAAMRDAARGIAGAPRETFDRSMRAARADAGAE